jgi:hypothetical protein
VQLLVVRRSSLTVRAVRRSTVRPHVESCESPEDEEGRGEGEPTRGSLLSSTLAEDGFTRGRLRLE